MDKLKEQVTNVLSSEKVWNAACNQAWEEYVANGFKTRHMFGPQNEAIRRDQVQLTRSVDLCLNDYKRVCNDPPNLGGRTFVLFGPHGAGKSQTLATLLHGKSPRAAERGILINAQLFSRSGNHFVRNVCDILSFSGDASKLAPKLVELAHSQTLRQELLGYCCTTEDNTIDDKDKIAIIPTNENPYDRFDKLPMIIIDHVHFVMKETEELYHENHIEAMEFLSNLYALAHSQRVVVFLGVQSLEIAKKIAVLNGNTKIVPSKVSTLDDTTSLDSQQIKVVAHKQTATVESGITIEILWGKNFRWTVETMGTFLKRQYKFLPDAEIDRIAKEHWMSGNLRAALSEAADTYPSLANMLNK